MKKDIVKPNLFFVGQTRTGTHALHYLLGQHPEIYVSKIKETAYFAQDFHRESDEYHGGRQKYFHFRTEEQYLKLFRKIKNAKYSCEVSSIYLYSKTAAREIYKFNKESKILMMFREPVSWLTSYHSQAYHFIGEDRRDLREALEVEKYRKQGKCLSQNVIAPSLLYYSEFFKYGDQLKRYLDLFGWDNVRVFIYEEFKLDNFRIYDEIVDFLGIDKSFRPVSKRLNAAKAKPRLPLHNFLRTPLLQKAFLKVFGPGIRQMFAEFYWQDFFSFEEKPAIDKELRLVIMKAAKPEVEALGKLLGRDLITYWGYGGNDLNYVSKSRTF